MDRMALGVRLEEAAKHNHFRPGTQLSGLANVEAHLTGTGDGPSELEGAGRVRAAGRMFDLPFVLTLLKLPTLRVPDGTAFEEAEAVVRVHGQKGQVERLDLTGGALGVRDLPPKLSQSLFRIRATGRLGGPDGLKFTPEPVPVLTDPVRQLVEKVRARQQPPPAAARAVSGGG